MSQQYSSGVQGQCTLDNNPWMHLRPIHGAGKQPLHRDELMPIVEKCRLEMLPQLASQPQSEERAAGRRVTQQKSGPPTAPLKDLQRTGNCPVFPRLNLPFRWSRPDSGRYAQT